MRLKAFFAPLSIGKSGSSVPKRGFGELVDFGLVFVIAVEVASQKSGAMESKRGRWIGFAISGCFLGLIAMSLVAATTGASHLEAVFSRVCHQFSDRCYQIWGVTLPICVRCLWIYLGLAAGHVLFIYWKPDSNRITRALIGVIGLMFLDVLLEVIGLYENWFWSRAITGCLFGLVLSHFTLLGLRELYIELTNSKNYVRSKLFTHRSR